MAPKHTAKRRRPGDLGSVEGLPSGRFRAYYRMHGVRYCAPDSFSTPEAARAWLAAERADRAAGTWTAPEGPAPSLDIYARAWLASRNDLAPRTRALYTRALNARILAPAGDPTAGRLNLAALTLDQLTPGLVREWFTRMSADCAAEAAARRGRKDWAPGQKHGAHPARAWARGQGLTVSERGRISPTVLTAWRAAGQPADDPRTAVAAPGAPGRTAAAHAYRLLHTILNSAVEDGLIATNVATLRGAGTVRHAERGTATPGEVAALAAAMPDRLAVAVWLAAWSGLRQGELLALARRHVDVETGSVRVERALGRDRSFHQPKTRSSVRTVYLPRFVLDKLTAHLDAHTATGPDALVFATEAGDPYPAQRLLDRYARARASIGRPELSWHDLRHTGATLAYGAGGSVREVQRRLGHATERAAMRYAHAADDSDRRLADRLDAAYGTPATESPTPSPTPPRALTDARRNRPAHLPTSTAVTPAPRRHLYAVPDLPAPTERTA